MPCVLFTSHQCWPAKNSWNKKSHTTKPKKKTTTTLTTAKSQKSMCLNGAVGSEQFIFLSLSSHKLILNLNLCACLLITMVRTSLLRQMKSHTNNLSWTMLSYGTNEHECCLQCSNALETIHNEKTVWYTVWNWVLEELCTNFCLAPSQQFY